MTRLSHSDQFGQGFWGSVRTAVSRGSNESRSRIMPITPPNGRTLAPVEDIRHVPNAAVGWSCSRRAQWKRDRAGSEPARGAGHAGVGLSASLVGCAAVPPRGSVPCYPECPPLAPGTPVDPTNPPPVTPPDMQGLTSPFATGTEGGGLQGPFIQRVVRRRLRRDVLPQECVQHDSRPAADRHAASHHVHPSRRRAGRRSES